MTTTDILAIFLRLFPSYQDKIHEYWSGGDNTLKVKCHDYQELTFIYHNSSDWVLFNNPNRRKPV